MVMCRGFPKVLMISLVSSNRFVEGSGTYDPFNISCAVVDVAPNPICSLKGPDPNGVPSA